MVTVDKMKVGFIHVRGTIDAVFILKIFKKSVMLK